MYRCRFTSFCPPPSRFVEELKWYSPTLDKRAIVAGLCSTESFRSSWCHCNAIPNNELDAGDWSENTYSEVLRSQFICKRNINKWSFRWINQHSYIYLSMSKWTSSIRFVCMRLFLYERTDAKAWTKMISCSTQNKNGTISILLGVCVCVCVLSRVLIRNNHLA